MCSSDLCQTQPVSDPFGEQSVSTRFQLEQKLLLQPKVFLRSLLSIIQYGHDTLYS